MRRNRSLVTLGSLSKLLFLALLFAVVVRADQSQFVNAKVETRSVSQNIQSTVAQIAAESAQPVWIAYEVPAIPNEGTSCCGQIYHDGHTDYCGTCNLEHEHGELIHVQSSEKNKDGATVKLENDSNLMILYRLDQKQVMRIRMASSNCTLDAGGLRVIWLTGVKPEDSVNYLASFVKEENNNGHRDNLSEQSLSAIAQHADASADRLFATFVAPNQPEWLRDKTSFWLGVSRSKSGLALLEKMAKDDPSQDVRAKVAFALSLSHEPAAVDDMIHIAKDDPQAHVRSQALFWLAQKAGQKASAAITGAIDNDPDTEVKKKAVFALSQMPKDEGVPKLIQVAQTNKNPEVRKQAMFWLGQSGDPRAVAFFEKILSQ
jgi:hypothetical protein